MYVFTSLLDGSCPSLFSHELGAHKYNCIIVAASSLSSRYACALERKKI